MTLEIAWQITMRGRNGYSCVTLVSCENAPLADHAIAIARLMFPELEVEQAIHVYTANKVEPVELPG